MTEEERAYFKEMVREVMQEEVPKILKDRECLINECGVSLEEHKEQHKTIKKIMGDVATARRCFLAGVVTTITGGILGLAWLWLKTKVQ